MFGYIRPRIAALRVAEYEIYRGVYCGLCRTMGHVSGQASRMTLSYDFCFLALLRMALAAEKTDGFQRIRCPIHCTGVRLCAPENAALRHTAAAAAYLLEGKRADDWSDEHGARRMRAGLAAPFTRAMCARAGRQEPVGRDMKTLVEEKLSALTLLEAEKCDSADRAAQAFGELLSALFAYDLRDDADRAIAAECGMRAGRFIYLCDAMDDLAEDRRRGRYNPLLYLWGERALDANGRPAEPVRESFRTAALLDLTGMGRAVELLPDGVFTEILRNVVYLGMPDTARTVAAGGHLTRRDAGVYFDTLPENPYGE